MGGGQGVSPVASRMDFSPVLGSSCKCSPRHVAVDEAVSLTREVCPAWGISEEQEEDDGLGGSWAGFLGG